MPYPHCRQRVRRERIRVTRPEAQVVVLTEKTLDNGDRIIMRSAPGFKGEPTTVMRGRISRD
jgi:hypothetical protein